MSILLNAGVEVAFLTKGAIQERFLALFSTFRTKVFAQVGITTLDERIQQVLEPQAAAPKRRLQAIEDLARIGIATRARLDPLVPNLTDTGENLCALLAELGKLAVRSVAASYLFLRPAFAQRLSEQLNRFAGEACSFRMWAWRRLADGVGGGQMLAPSDRRGRFDRLGALAAKYGISLHVCACKNPDLGLGSDCQIAGPSPGAAGDAPLFDSAGVTRARP
jgi:DNA repair photolyase